MYFRLFFNWIQSCDCTDQQITWLSLLILENINTVFAFDILRVEKLKYKIRLNLFNIHRKEDKSMPDYFIIKEGYLILILYEQDCYFNRAIACATKIVVIHLKDKIMVWTWIVSAIQFQERYVKVIEIRECFTQTKQTNKCNMIGLTSHSNWLSLSE